MGTVLIVAYAILAIVVFIIGREIFAWYAKVNERIKLMQENNFLLRKVAEKLGATPQELEFNPPKKK
jgi:uncharacterized membrane protein YjfL (UPF0719 family)